MADSSESDSVSLMSSQINEQSNETKQRFYAMYYHNHRNQDQSSDKDDFNLEDDNENESNLCIIATNLSAQSETDLRKSLSHKLLNKARMYGEGNIFSVGLNLPNANTSAASCYYCVVTSSSDNLGFNHVTKDGKTSTDDPECQEYVICFISFHESSLDLFRSEIDEYTKGFVPLLDKEPFDCLLTSKLHYEYIKNSSSNNSLTPTKKLNQLSSGIHQYLENWPSIVFGFLSRTITLMGPSIQYLMYAGLLNTTVQVSGASEEQEKDFKKFISCCYLPGLLTDAPNDKGTEKRAGTKSDEDQSNALSLKITDGLVTFDKTYNCQFCTNAASKLIQEDQSNVTRLRELLESFKLSFAHNLNKLKRFLGQGETDFYGIHRALSYLRKCGCGSLLLRYVKMGASEETLSVVGVIEHYLKEMKQTL